MSIEVHSVSEFRMAEEEEPNCCQHGSSPVPQDIHVFLCSEAIRKAIVSARTSFSEGKEALGYLVGRPFLSGGKMKIRISGVVELPAIATAHHVEIDRDTGDNFEISIGDGELIVGWYHSHTGQGCFLSSTDTRTHERWFTQAYSVALVIEGSDGDFEIFASKGNMFYSPAYCIFDGK